MAQPERNPPPATVENWMRVGDIAQASRKFHLPGHNADVTNPYVVVALLHPYYRPRVQFDHAFAHGIANRVGYSDP